MCEHTYEHCVENICVDFFNVCSESTEFVSELCVDDDLATCYTVFFGIYRGVVCLRVCVRHAYLCMCERTGGLISTDIQMYCTTLQM